MQPCSIDDVVALIVQAAQSAATRRASVQPQTAADGGRPTVIIGMDGRSGTGKTSTADMLAAVLASGSPEPTPIVHMDDLYPGWHGLAEAVPQLVQYILRPVSRGERAAYRRYDWQTSAYAERLHLEPGPFLVVEGCGSTVGPARPYTDVRVWLDAPPDIRRTRSLARDGGTFRPMWSAWQQQEDALFNADHTRDHAHLVITTGGG